MESNGQTPVSPLSSTSVEGTGHAENDNYDGISSRIKVCVRLRPVVKMDYNDISCYNQNKSRTKKICSTPSIATTLNPDGQTIRVVSDIQETKEFFCNNSFDQCMTSQYIYEKSCGDAVNSFVNGYNACIMCYGQSGSGKTYTMFGDILEIPNENEEVVKLKPNKSSAATLKPSKKAVKSLKGRANDCEAKGDEDISDISDSDSVSVSEDIRGSSSQNTPYQHNIFQKGVHSSCSNKLPEANVPGMFQMTVFEIFSKIRESASTDGVLAMKDIGKECASVSSWEAREGYVSADLASKRIEAALIKERESRQRSKRVDTVLLSCYQIYLEKITDLLASPVDAKSQSQAKRTPELVIREFTQENEDGDHNLNPKQTGPYIPNLTVIEVSDEAAAICHVVKALKRGRIVRSTSNNAVSSRSHVIIQLTKKTTIVHQHSKTEHSSTLYMVDLAGSEKLKYEESRGVAMKESVSIGLASGALQRCVQAIRQQQLKSKSNATSVSYANNDSKLHNSKVIIPHEAHSKDSKSKAKANIHVPYRDSKLTRLLRNCLGGSIEVKGNRKPSNKPGNAVSHSGTVTNGVGGVGAKTVIIVNISPCSAHIQETVASLRFANSCSKIETQIYKNVPSFKSNSIPTPVEERRPCISIPRVTNSHLLDAKPTLSLNDFIHLLNPNGKTKEEDMEKAHALEEKTRGHDYLMEMKSDDNVVVDRDTDLDSKLQLNDLKSEVVTPKPKLPFKMKSSVTPGKVMILDDFQSPSDDLTPGNKNLATVTPLRSEKRINGKRSITPLHRIKLGNSSTSTPLTPYKVNHSNVYSPTRESVEAHVTSMSKADSIDRPTNANIELETPDPHLMHSMDSTPSPPPPPPVVSNDEISQLNPYLFPGESITGNNQPSNASAIKIRSPSKGHDGKSNSSNDLETLLKKEFVSISKVKIDFPTLPQPPARPLPLSDPVYQYYSRTHDLCPIGHVPKSDVKHEEMSSFIDMGMEEDGNEASAPVADESKVSVYPEGIHRNINIDTFLTMYHASRGQFQ